MQAQLLMMDFDEQTGPPDFAESTLRCTEGPTPGANPDTLATMGETNSTLTSLAWIT